MVDHADDIVGAIAGDPDETGDIGILREVQTIEGRFRGRGSVFGKGPDRMNVHGFAIVGHAPMVADRKNVPGTALQN